LTILPYLGSLELFDWFRTLFLKALVYIVRLAILGVPQDYVVSLREYLLARVVHLVVVVPRHLIQEIIRAENFVHQGLDVRPNVNIKMDKNCACIRQEFAQ